MPKIIDLFSTCGVEGIRREGKGGKEAVFICSAKEMEGTRGEAVARIYRLRE